MTPENMMTPNTEFNLNTLQDEVGAWSRHNFGDQPSVNPLLGAFEELGEFQEANARYHEELAANENKAGSASTADADMEDAVGDTVIYLADYCHRNDLSLAECELAGSLSHLTADPVHMLILEMGRLAHAHLKTAQGIRTTEDHERTRRVQVGRLVVWLRLACRDLRLHFDRAVVNTWHRVRQRDWKKDPAGAGTTPVQETPREVKRYWIAEMLVVPGVYATDHTGTIINTRNAWDASRFATKQSCELFIAGFKHPTTWHAVEHEFDEPAPATTEGGEGQ